MPMINAVVMKRQVYSVEKYLNSVTKNTNGIAIGMIYDIDITPELIFSQSLYKKDFYITMSYTI